MKLLLSCCWTRPRSGRAIFAANPHKAPGLASTGSRPASVVWKGLWPVLQDQLLKLFQNSLSEAYLPRALETGEDYITP